MRPRSSRSVSTTDAVPDTRRRCAQPAASRLAMREFLHLLVVDRERGMAAAAAYDGRWFLPIVCGPSRARAAPLVLEWLARRGMGGDVLGQWLGRVAPDGRAIDWLMAVASDARTNAGSGLRWIPLHALRSSPSLMEYQQWALATATGNMAL